MASETTPRAPVRALFEGVEGNALLLISAAFGLSAGVLHLVVTQAHFAEHVGQGLFMVTLAFLQVLWAVWFVRRPSAGGFAAGVALMLGAILVWIFAITVRAPFSAGPESPEPIAWCTEAAQLVSLLALVALPFSRSGAVGFGIGRAVPVVALILLLGLVAGAGAYGAGLVGEKLAPQLGESAAGMDDMQPASDHGGDAAAPGSTGMSMGANASTNATATAPASDANMPSDPSACMSGMDMPGCTSAQADAYFKKMSAQAPPPDKQLAPVKIPLAQDGSGETGKFTVDNGTMHLIVKIELKDDGSGAYLVQGPGQAPSSGDLEVLFTAPGAKTPAFKITLKGSGGSVGVSGVNSLDLTANGETAMPLEGDWVVSLGGSGIGAGTTISLTERFFM